MSVKLVRIVLQFKITNVNAIVGDNGISYNSNKYEEQLMSLEKLDVFQKYHIAASLCEFPKPMECFVKKFNKTYNPGLW